MTLPKDLNSREYTKFREVNGGTSTSVVLEPITPTTGNNPSYATTEVLVGTVLTTTIVKTISGTDYTKIFVEDSSDGSSTVTAWS